MLPIEETKAVHHVANLHIPTGASREFGEEAIKSAIEHQATNANATLVSNIFRRLSVVWRRLIGGVTGQDLKEAAH